jgi:TonB-linked SusC/RagA family outer membrane protein
MSKLYLTQLNPILMSMKKPLQLTCLLLYASSGVFAASRATPAGYPSHLLAAERVAVRKQVKQDVVTGTVRDSTGTTLIGVSVKIRGTATGTQTDASGKFSIPAKQGDVLVFSYVGYDAKEVTVGAERTINVVLSENNRQLTEVVVTAFGVKRSERSLTYANQQVSGDELTKVRTDNFMNSLNGKIAGVNISPSASGVGGSTKVILRGNRSFTGNNQPLFVVDGIPVSNVGNSSGQPNNPFGGSTNVDAGDGISNLNPDDIESMSVLKGSAATALYGSEGANGVILITTKSGRAGKMQIGFNSSFTTNHIATKPEFQNSYGQTTATSKDSWGAKISGGNQDNLNQFYQNGYNFANSLNLSGGTENSQTYFSYANTRARGVEPGNKLDRNNFDLRETAKFLDKKLTVDGSINYVDQRIYNTPGIGLYFNPLTGLYLFPRGVDITPYKNQYEFANQGGYARQNWVLPNGGEDIQQNPWWIVNRNPNYLRRHRILLNGSVKYDFNKYLNLQVRGSVDRNTDSFEQDLYSGTQSTLSRPNGQYIINNGTLEQKYGDVLLTFNLPEMSGFKIDGLAGASIKDWVTEGTNVGAGLGLSVPNLFIAQNTIVNGLQLSNTSTIPAKHSQYQSIYGNINFSYNDWAFLNLTARQDWSSTLAYTNDVSFFYPSVGLSVLLTKALHLPTAITYAKVRANYAQVGNYPLPYYTYPVGYNDPASGGFNLSSVAPYPTLKPERTKSWEFGTDLRFFNDDLTASFSYYKTNTFNQTVAITPSASTTYSLGYVNAGNVENKGFEFLLGYNVLKSKSFTWNSSINGARNINKVIDVAGAFGINQFILTGNANTNYQSVIRTGGSYGDIYGNTVKRDAQGRIVVNADGAPQTNNGFNYIGNPNPKFNLGWNNNFTYKNINLSLLVDGKFGGKVLSMTQALMDQYGVSKATGDARDAGGVAINGVSADGAPVTSVDPKTWYGAIGGKNGISEMYVYSATTVRLREAVIGYTFPLQSKVVKSLRLAVTGRNLLYFYKKAPYDPEVTLSTGNGLSGVDIFSLPATRNLGFSLNVTL